MAPPCHRTCTLCLAAVCRPVAGPSVPPAPPLPHSCQAVKDATNTGVRESGIDVRLCDVGAAIQVCGWEFGGRCVKQCSLVQAVNTELHRGAAFLPLPH